MRIPLFVRAGVVALQAGLVLATAAAENHRVTLAPAGVDRAGQVVTITIPRGAPQPTALRDAAGRVTPLQVDADSAARFVVPLQKAGESLTFTFVRVNGIADKVTVTDDAANVSVRTGGQPVLVYRKDRDNVPRAGINPDIKRAGYIHPVYSPAGKIVTDDYPPNHAWHHGIWTPWVKTAFQGRTPDFWNMEKKLGRQDFVALERTWNGPVHGGFASRQQMVDLGAATPLVVLNETWVVRAYDMAGAARPVRMFDLEVTQTCATNDRLELPKFHYGGFGFRGAAEWNGPGDVATFLTSDGVTDRIKGNNTRGNWCFLGGKLDGAISGTAILGHP
ncbi:MAG: DUF6807 family protein, partial [Opitutaceae bacterium]